VNDSTTSWSLSGLAVRFLEPDALPKGLMSGDLQPGRAFLRHFDADQFEGAIEKTVHTGALDEVSACALGDAVMQLGTPGGFLDAGGMPLSAVRGSFTRVATDALRDGALATALFDGGLLDRRGSARHFLGALPARVIARQVTRESISLARGRLTGGWDEDLLNVLESAALRATSHPEDLLVLVPLWERVVESSGSGIRAASPSAPRPAPRQKSELHLRLREALAQGASDIVISDEAEQLAEQWLTPVQRDQLNAERLVVTSFTLGDLGRFRMTATIERARLRLTLRSGGAINPSLERLGLTAEAQQALTSARQGLVVLAGGPASGRSTTFAALMQHFTDLGLSCTTLEHPVFFSLLGVRQVELTADQSLSVFRQSARLLPVDVVGFDLVDDEAGVDAGLEAAADGRLAVVVMRSLTVTAAVHRLTELDARWSRRRLSEHLALVHCQQRSSSQLLVPSEALRRHLRGNATPAPPVLLEPPSNSSNSNA